MKTIKELEVYFKENYSDWWKGYKEALKDVLRLIDEYIDKWSLDAGNLSEQFKELKSKIEG